MVKDAVMLKGLVNIYSIAVFGVLLALCYQTGILHTLPWIFIYLAVGVLGFSLGFVLVLFNGKDRRPPVTSDPPRAANVLIMKVMELMTRRRKLRPRKVSTSRNMEKAINEVFELVIRDYVSPWYNKLGKDDAMFVDALQDDLWELIENLTKRLQKVDMVRCLTSDVVYKLCDYFQQLRECSASRNTNTPKPFYLHPCLASDEAETEFIRETAEVLLVLLLPQQVSGCETAKHLLREIITCNVLKPAIDILCDPDYINHNILSYLEYREQLAEKHKKNYSYAATYEEFIKLINMCNDLEELQQIRYHIINEIMQVTVIQELKKNRGPEAEKTPKGGTGKAGDLLRARNLNRYINQCKVAKSQCEKRIRIVGGLDFQSYYRYTSVSPLELNRQRVLSLEEILRDTKARDHFRSFLKRTSEDDLLTFWVAVEYMKGCKKLREQHIYGNEIYQTFVATESEIHVDKNLVSGMESFLVGNKGPESFYQAQHQIYQQLDEDHYPSFLISDFYSKLMDGQDGSKDGDLSEEILQKKGLNMQVPPSPKEDLENTTTSFAEQTDAVMSKLHQVEEKLNYKTQALSNLTSSGTHSSESKMQRLLEKEIEMLKLERRELEQYVERTDLWCEYAGKWRTDICSSKVMGEGDKPEPYYVIVVHPTDPQIPISGWVVSRRLSEFHFLQQRLKECSKWLSKAELPQLSRKLFKSIDQEFLDKSASQLQKYLTSVLQDETLRHSEALYIFLVPSPLCSKIEITDEKEKKEKKHGFLTGIFRNSPPDHDVNREDLDAVEDGSQDRKDSIAEPIYALISEIFELHGMFKWLRRNFIVFVQITLGGTINKGLRGAVEWFVSEPMLVFYIHYFRDSFWPKGQLAPPYPVFTAEQKQQTKDKASEKSLRYFPDFLQNLLGKRNSKLGARKVFEALQDKIANKHLFYNLLEVVLLELCPELKDPKLVAKVEAEEKKLQQTNHPRHNDQTDSNLMSQRLGKDHGGEDQISDEEGKSASLLQRTTGSGAESGEETM